MSGTLQSELTQFFKKFADSKVSDAIRKSHRNKVYNSSSDLTWAILSLRTVDSSNKERPFQAYIGTRGCDSDTILVVRTLDPDKRVYEAGFIPFRAGVQVSITNGSTMKLTASDISSGQKSMVFHRDYYARAENTAYERILEADISKRTANQPEWDVYGFAKWQ